jgi:cytosine/adenosine deaminase-related metal-dependent hydrolase
MKTRRRLLTFTAVAMLMAGLAAAGQLTDYVTEEEEDLIRDAQGLELRVPAFLKLLDNRIVALGLRQRTAKEREQTKKDIAEWEDKKRVIEKLKIAGAELPAKPLNPDLYLRHETPSALLRGYMQIIDETMDNIEDSFERRLDVRSQVAALEKFITEQLPRLKTLETKTPAEAAVLKETIRHSEGSLDDIRLALKTLPKTEKK